MGKWNPHGDNITRRLPDDAHDKAWGSEEGGPPGDASRAAGLKRRWKTLLAWLARGAEHACPT